MTAPNFIASLDTEVPIGRSVAAIQELVEKFGARSFQTTYSSMTGVPEAIRFTLVDPKTDGVLTIALSAPSDGIYGELVRRAQRLTQRPVLRAKAERIAWRHLHDFVRATLIAIQDGLLTVGDAFLSHLVVSTPDGAEHRFGDALRQSGILMPGVDGRLLLGSGQR